MRRVEENRHASSLQLSKEVESQTGVTISRDTIRRTLQRNGMHGCRPRNKPLLKPRHKKARLEFARAHADKDEDYWDSILWSDETKINVFGTDGFKTVWRRKGEEYKEKCMVPTVKHGGGSVLMWGCMSAAGVGELHFIDGIMNSQMYCSILKEKILPSLRALGRRELFQHDNDPKHTSKATVGFLKKSRVKVIQWQSMSPDLNPIEHLWGILKRQVEHHSPSSIQSLKEVILEEWKKIWQNVANLFIPCLEDLVLSLKIMEAIQSTRFCSFCSGVYSFSHHPNLSKTEKCCLEQWFSNFLHQVPPQKIFGFPSTTIMTNIKMQYKWLPTAPGVCSRCVCVCVCSLLCVCALWMG